MGSSSKGLSKTHKQAIPTVHGLTDSAQSNLSKSNPCPSQVDSSSISITHTENETSNSSSPLTTSQKKFRPPTSPHDLIQEHYVNDPQFEWKVLVCCFMLNQTSRKQLDKVIDSFFEKWSCPWDLLVAPNEEVAEHIRSLGFKNRRTERLKRMSDEFIEAKKLAALERGEGASLTGEKVRDLHGVGEYAARAYEIFCLGKLGEKEPEDGPLTKYWAWATENATSYERGWL